MPLDQPIGVVGFAEIEEHLTEFLDRFESAEPKQVFLQRADEALGATVALWRTDKGGRALNAEERDLLLEVVRHVLRAVVVTHGEATGDILGEPPEVPPHTLSDGVQGLEVRVPVDREH